MKPFTSNSPLSFTLRLAEESSDKYLLNKFNDTSNDPLALFVKIDEPLTLTVYTKTGNIAKINDNVTTINVV